MPKLAQKNGKYENLLINLLLKYIICLSEFLTQNRNYIIFKIKALYGTCLGINFFKTSALTTIQIYFKIFC